MAAITPPSLTPAPTPAPQRNDRVTFSDRVDTFVTWLITAVTEFGAVASNVYANATDAYTSAGTATTKAALTAADAIQTASDRVAADASATMAVNAAASISSQVSAPIHDATSKTTPVDADELGLVDSAASNVLKKLTWANLKATLATWINGGTLEGSFTTLNASGAATFSAGAQITGVALLGYGTGAGGTVTQATTKTASVTLNKPCGRITMSNSALESGASVNFQLNNSLITDGNVVVVITGYFGAVNPGSYSFITQYPIVGSIIINVTNITAGSLSEAVQFNFAIIKGAAA